MKTEKLLGRLRKKVLGPEGQGARSVFLEEVTVSPVGTGRRLDAIAVGMWRSRGHLLEGFELKTSRSDWLGELKDPSKAEELARFCDRFWLVIGDESVADLSEVPAKWGLMVAKGSGLSTIRDASPLEPEERPDYFIASLLRRAVRGDLRKEQKVMKQVAEEDAERKHSSKLKIAEQKAEFAEAEMKEFRDTWAAFKDITGEDFGRWMRFDQRIIKRVGKVVAALRTIDADESSLHHFDPVSELDRALGRVDQARETLATARQELLDEPVPDQEVPPTINP